MVNEHAAQPIAASNVGCASFPDKSGSAFFSPTCQFRYAALLDADDISHANPDRRVQGPAGVERRSRETWVFMERLFWFKADPGETSR